MNEMREKAIRLSIFSFPSHLCVVRAALAKVCELIGFDGDTAGNVVLSVDEALSNIIKHAYGGADDRPIEIELVPLAAGGRSGLRIELRDYGRSVDRRKIKSRDLEDVRPGGLGVHIMSQCMDSVEFNQAEGGGTLLTMTKMLADSESKQEAAK